MKCATLLVTPTNPVTNSGIKNFDISLFKSFRFRDPANLQLRAEAYNAFNHTQFSPFNATARFDTARAYSVR